MPQNSPKEKLNIEEEALLSLLKNKDKRGFDILYSNYAGALYGLIYKTVSSETLANELLGLVFAKILHDIDSYAASKTSLFAWLYRTTQKILVAHQTSALKNESHLKVIRGDFKIAN